MLTPAITIQKKRDGEALSPEELHGFIRGLQTGEVTDYQATAFLMAVYFQGMTLDETVVLTRAMLESGDRYDLAGVKGPKVDKHSTGGVGDKVSLILAPLAAACGLKVPMMSGRGLGHTGGTLDKLESIEGFDVRLTRERFEQVLSKIGCAMIGQSERVVPADRKLYALRDVTATVECIPLIVASILSKKLAEGTQGLVLDVKTGSGAFMKSRADARKLAQTLVKVGAKLGLRVRAVLTDMSQPLGYAVGNAIEVRECVEVLRNEKSSLGTTSSDLRELTLQLCAQMLVLGGLARKLAEGRKLAESRLSDGSAWKIFLELVREQKGSLAQVMDLAKLPRSPKSVTWTAKKRGFLGKIDTQAIGRILVELGGGRKKVTDSVDPGVGLVFHKKLGARIQLGDPLVTVHAPESAESLQELEAIFHQAIQITADRKPVPKLIQEVIG